MAHRLRTACAAALGVSAAVLCASRAEAQDAGFPTCASAVAADTTAFTGSPTIVYIAGSTASQVPLQAFAVPLAASNVAIIYQAPDSCQGVNDLVAHTAESATTKYVFLDPQQLDANGLAKAIQCTPPSPAPPIDIAPSDVYPETCFSKLNLGATGITTTSNTFRDVLGPVQAMTLAVPSASTANSISAEAGNIVFANDATNFVVNPWSSAANIFTRPNTSGTLGLLGAAMGLSPANFANATPSSTPPAQQQKGTGNMLTALTGASSANANSTIGQLSYSAIQTSATPSALKILAFQAKGQKCGYTPSSTATALDMINVRQGRYAAFGPLHLIVNVSSSGQYLDGSMNPSAAVTSILNYFIATGPNPPSSSSGDGGVSQTTIQNVIKAEAKPGYVVPWCAMQVTRTSELGAPASYQPSIPCGCYYESLLGVIPSSGADPISSYCHSCGSDSDCADSGTYTHCRYGYCEAQ